jgi:hypothetical protein
MSGAAAILPRVDLVDSAGMSHRTAQVERGRMHDRTLFRQHHDGHAAAMSALTDSP